MNWGALVPLALGGAGAYFGYKAQKNTKKNSERAYEAYLAQKAAQQGSGGGRSGGGGGGSNPMGGILSGNMERTNQQYALALELLKPYVDASAAAIPKQQEAYMKSLDGLNSFASSFLNPDMVKKLSESPSPSSFERPLPSYLMGGKK